MATVRQSNDHASPTLRSLGDRANIRCLELSFNSTRTRMISGNRKAFGASYGRSRRSHKGRTQPRHCLGRA